MGRSKRAKRQNPELLALAAERGIEVHAGMTDGEIGHLLGPTPPTAKQVEYAKDLANTLRRPDPPVLRSFGHARAVLVDLETLANEYILARHGWQEGSVVRWREDYWLIVEVRPARLYYRLCMVPADLEPDEAGDTRVVRRKVKLETHAPHTLSKDTAQTVDLSSWPPQLLPPPSDDE